MIGEPQHTITAVVAGQQIGDWQTYDIATDMLTPADRFTMRLPFNRATWDLCKADRPVKVRIDDVTVISGLIGERLVPEDDESIEIIGRDLVGRLVDESAPGLDYAGLSFFDLVKKVADPWFKTVTFSNARNRSLLRGRGKKAKAAGEPLKLVSHKKVGTHIEPGQTRWQVIETLCAQAGYLCWSAGDGTELIIGEPNYDQEIQFRFFMPEANSTRTDESTVLGLGVRDSVEERYSRVLVVGSGTGDVANYGAAVSQRWGEAKNNPATLAGEGLDFVQPKQLIIQRSVASLAEANELARREMSRRDARGSMLTVRAGAHGQVVAGGQPTIFAPDTLASVEDERTGTIGTYLITACTYRSGRQGEETLMTLVKKGSELTSS